MAQPVITLVVDWLKGIMAASASTVGSCPEILHEGLITISSFGDRQWLSHSLTGEKCWLPQVPGGWELCHHQGWAYVRGSSESLWVSGERPLFQCSLHEDSNGKRFIRNRSEEKKTWLDVARREFTCWQLEINEPVVTTQAEMWEMKLPFEGNTVFMNLGTSSHFGCLQIPRRPGLRASTTA